MACTMSLGDRDPSMAVSADGEVHQIPTTSQSPVLIGKLITSQVASCYLV